jgi:hypothetical protein
MYNVKRWRCIFSFIYLFILFIYFLRDSINIHQQWLCTGYYFSYVEHRNASSITLKDKNKKKKK